jgi:hypothetical protein
MIRSEIRHNTAGGSGGTSNVGGGAGGGILNRDGNVMLVASTVADNAAGFGGGDGGPGGSGGGIANVRGELMIARSTISNNRSGNGGGSQFPISGGFDGGPGGGLFNSGGTVTLVNSTVSGNQTGRGFGNQNSQGRGGEGGGVANFAGTVQIASCTIAANQTGRGFGGDDSGSGGGLFNANSGTVVIDNTILAQNTAQAGGADCAGILTSGAYNLVAQADGCSVTVNTLTGSDAQLAALQDNGGPTETHALLPGSPAIDAGNPQGCGDLEGGTLASDQRGAPRAGVGNARCDIGAYEVAALPPACAGDCDGNSRVTVDEIVTGVNLALNTVSPGACAALDTDSSRTVTVDEIVAAVTNLLFGCRDITPLLGVTMPQERH